MKNQERESRFAGTRPNVAIKTKISFRIIGIKRLTTNNPARVNNTSKN